MEVSVLTIDLGGEIDLIQLPDGTKIVDINTQLSNKGWVM
jgi:hypothetical protein